MDLSVIITTYNSPEWLEKVLTGYDMQSFKGFEVIIADDGSGDDTKKLVDACKKRLSYPISHVWHPDEGFRKCTILNKAILASATDYLVFTDGDCIPRMDFLEAHMQNRAKGYFLSGGYYMLPMDISNLIQEEDIRSGRCFDLKWLKKNGLPMSFKNSKLFKNKVFSGFLNAITPTKPTWNGHNVSGWKKDILAVNGYNEDMKYGALDRELGERMMNNGIHGKQIRYSAICIHLDHKRSYKNSSDLAANKKIRELVKLKKLTWTENGIDLHKKEEVILL